MFQFQEIEAEMILKYKTLQQKYSVRGV